MLKKELEKIVGGLSKPSKMPGPAYNLPAYKCITGQKLAQVKGSVCYGCYALKGRYRFKPVKNAMERRLEALQHPGWVDAMIQLIKPHKNLDGTTAAIYNRWSTYRIYSVFAGQRLAPSTGCQPVKLKY